MRLAIDGLPNLETLVLLTVALVINNIPANG